MVSRLMNYIQTNSLVKENISSCRILVSRSFYYLLRESFPFLYLFTSLFNLCVCNGGSFNRVPGFFFFLCLFVCITTRDTDGERVFFERVHRKPNCNFDIICL